MATNKSAIEMASGDKRQELSLPPSYVVMVVGSEAETDPVILDLANEGFLTLRFDPTHKHFAYDERAGDLIPSDESVESFAAHGQIQPGIIKRDGDKYFVDVGRMRLKMCAVLNQKASKKEGKHIQPHLFRCITARKGDTEEDSFARQIIENADRMGDKPCTTGSKLSRARDRFKWTPEYCEIIFHIKPPMQELYIRLLDCSADVRPHIDSGKIPMSIAARLLPKLERDKQLQAVESIWALGITKGAAFEEALRRVIDGKAPVDESEAPVPQSGNRSGAPPSDAAPIAEEEAPRSDDKPASKPAAKPSKATPETPAKRVNAPTKQRLASWVDTLKDKSTQPILVAVPAMAKGHTKAERRDIDEEIEAVRTAALCEGARLLAMRMLGKTPPGWGKLRDMLEASETAEE